MKIFNPESKTNILIIFRIELQRNTKGCEFWHHYWLYIKFAILFSHNEVLYGWLALDHSLNHPIAFFFFDRNHPIAVI